MTTIIPGADPHDLRWIEAGRVLRRLQPDVYRRLVDLLETMTVAALVAEKAENERSTP